MPKASRYVDKISSGLRQCRPYFRTHFGQEGEDIALERIFVGQDHGVYVDVGAHHPFRFSNTYWAYRRGWSGLNIDATPGFDAAFRRWRRRDVNVAAFISTEEGEREFTVFDEPALNTGTRGRIEMLARDGNRIGQSIRVPAFRLDALLHRYLPRDTQIDFLSIDVEGSEMEVLRSNDWIRFRPRVVIVEVLHTTLASIDDASAIRFLVDLGYTPVSMLYHSVILIGDPDLLDKHWGEPRQ